MTVIERDALIAQAAKAIPPGMAGAYPDTTRRAVAAEMLGPALDQLEGAVSAESAELIRMELDTALAMFGNQKYRSAMLCVERARRYAGGQ